MAFTTRTKAAEVAQALGEHARGKVVLITGATSGIGLEAALALAPYAKTLVLPARNPDKALKVAEALRREAPGADVRHFPLDLGSFASVREFVRQFDASGLALDVLVNNAGTMDSDLTPDGWSRQFATNHLGHFLLTHLLLENPARPLPERIITVASDLHKQSRPLVLAGATNLMTPNEPYAGYCKSKLANVYHTVELHRRYGPKGVLAVALEPGFTRTALGGSPVLGAFLYPFQRSVQRGAATLTYLVLSPAVRDMGGKYFFDFEVRATSALAQDADAARRLYEFSLKAVGA